MFAYTQSKGGIRRGNIQQSSGEINLPAYNWDVGLLMGRTLNDESYEIDNLGYYPPKYLQNINIIEKNENYNIFKIDIFCNGELSEIQANPQRVSPYGGYLEEVYINDKTMVNTRIGFPFRIYGYICIGKENLPYEEQTKENILEYYNFIKDKTYNKSLSGFKKASGIITYDLKKTASFPDEQPIVYNAIDADFDSLQKENKDPIYSGYDYLGSKQNTFCEYSYYHNYQMRLCIGTNQDNMGEVIDISKPFLPGINFCLPIIKDKKMYLYSPKTYTNPFSNTQTFLGRDLEEIDQSKFNIINPQNGYISYNIPNKIQKIHIKYAYACGDGNEVQTEFNNIKFGYSFNGYIEPFVNKTS